MGSSSSVALECTDNKLCVVIFEQNNYDRHKRYHPELRHPAFFPERVKEAIKNPTFKIKGKTPYSMCYYLEEYSKNGIMLYTKVVLHEQFRDDPDNPRCIIKTAHRTDVIKETVYGHEKVYD